jgi:hypothetical protein
MGACTFHDWKREMEMGNMEDGYNNGAGIFLE